MAYRLHHSAISPVDIVSEKELRELLAALPIPSDDYEVLLESGARDFIRAKACDGLWSIQRRRGGWWTKQQFSAVFSTAWSQRKMSNGRSLWKWLTGKDEILFTQDQMVTLFTEHFSLSKYTYSYVGAG